MYMSYTTKGIFYCIVHMHGGHWLYIPIYFGHADAIIVYFYISMYVRLNDETEIVYCENI